MNTALIVTIVGVVIIAALGFAGRRRPSTDLADWTVGGRKFGTATMWFLQAGEIFTTFTFLGMAGLAFTSGVAAMYALPYVPLAYAGLYFIGPRIWRRGRESGHLTQADFLTDWYGSKALGVVVAILGVVFLLPYLQLQITGLGLAVQLATGNETSSNVSIVIAFVLTVAFVLWSGIRGVATTAYFKDALMLIVLLILIVVIPAHFNGGIGATFQQVLHTHPELLRIHAGKNDQAWFFTSMVASTIGVLFMTLPHQWPALLSAGSPKALRRNYIYLPIYSVSLGLPMLIGFVAVLQLKLPTGPTATAASNKALLTLAGQALPAWFVGVVVVATAATAMVPSAGLIIAMSSLISKNIVKTRGDRARFTVNQVAVVGVTAVALLMGIMRPDLLANLLLLTYSGLDQLVPAIGLALLARKYVGLWPVFAGLIVGEAVVIFLTFGGAGGTPFLSPDTVMGHVNVGIIGLVPNLVVVAIGAAIERATGRAPSPDRVATGA
jgi:SSS family solute:Na+ symporter